MCVCIYVCVYTKDKKVIGGSHHALAKGITDLTDPIAFYRDMTCSMDEERAVDIVYFYFSKTSDSPITSSWTN